MANKRLFGSANNGKSVIKSAIGSKASKAIRHKAVPATNTVNEAGGKAYSFENKHALAQYVATGTFGNQFYAGADVQLDQILALAKTVSPKFLAQCAVYGRDKAHMKDTPALLLALLAGSDDPQASQYFEKAFPHVCDNGKMLKNFCQIIRSGKAGRKSFGSQAKRLVQNWLNETNDKNLFRASIGNDPSLADVIRMVHPRPKDKKREAFFRYLLGKNDVDMKKLPSEVRDFEAFKKGDNELVPDVPFLMLTALPLSKNNWKGIAKTMGWHALRMNLNTLNRHGVFEDQSVVNYVAAKLSDAEEIKKAKVFPYQLLMAYKMVEDTLPTQITNALQDAMEIAVDNVPAIEGKVIVCPDVSGSMQSPATGNRGSATTKVTCVDVAALVAASILRKNPNAEVLPFDTSVHNIRLNPRDSVMTNAKKLAINGGGTSCYLPLAKLNRDQAKADLIFYVSDNMSWADFTPNRGTQGMREWVAFVQRNPQAKLVALDIQAYGSSQFQETSNVMNIGGFSDAVFDVVSEFAQGNLNSKHWVGVIEKTAL